MIDWQESLKVEMGLMEARHASSLHQLEAELHSSAERKVGTCVATTKALSKLVFLYIVHFELVYTLWLMCHSA